MELDKLTLNCFDKDSQIYMLKQIRRLHYEEALHCSNGWRLEYRVPDSGEIHYLLVRQNEPVALQYVKATSWLNEVQNEMAFILVWLGFTARNTQRLEVGQGNRAPLSFLHNRLPHMCEFEFWHDVNDDEDTDNKLAYLESKRDECESQVNEWQARLSDVTTKLDNLLIQQYLTENGIDLEIGDRLLITPEFASRYPDARGITVGSVYELENLHIGKFQQVPSGGIRNGINGMWSIPLPLLLSMREAYLTRFPHARRQTAKTPVLT